MSSDRKIVCLLGAALLALPLAAGAEAGWYGDWKDWSYRQSDGYWSNQYREPEARLIEKYEGFAGSQQNARSLVEGLRHDTPIRLSARDDSTSFNSPTKPMGYGNVNIALALAKASLADAGIRNPTPEQIQAALVGGTVTDRSGSQVKLAGVLNLRASGMGWGEIAHRLGFKLGELMRAHKEDRHEARHVHKFADRKDDRLRHDRVKVARVEKFERVHRPERAERIERPHRPERPERIERAERGHGRG